MYRWSLNLTKIPDSWWLRNCQIHRRSAAYRSWMAKLPDECRYCYQSSGAYTNAAAEPRSARCRWTGPVLLEKGWKREADTSPTSHFRWKAECERRGAEEVARIWVGELARLGQLWVGERFVPHLKSALSSKWQMPVCSYMSEALFRPYTPPQSKITNTSSLIPFGDEIL